MKKLVYGVGSNDSTTPIQKKNLKWDCPYYTRWCAMLQRCYSESHITRQPTYRDCSVCDEWLTFSNFRTWMISQEKIHGSLDKLHLDKDIIDTDNKIYCPEKCAFVSQLVNNFVLDSNASRGEYHIGVRRRKSGSYHSRCRDPFRKCRMHLGTFSTQEEAHEAWRKQKHIFACQLADIAKDSRIVIALQTKYRLNNII